MLVPHSVGWDKGRLSGSPLITIIVVSIVAHLHLIPGRIKTEYQAQASTPAIVTLVSHSTEFDNGRLLGSPLIIMKVVGPMAVHLIHGRIKESFTQ